MSVYPTPESLHLFFAVSHAPSPSPSPCLNTWNGQLVQKYFDSWICPPRSATKYAEIYRFTISEYIAANSNVLQDKDSRLPVYIPMETYFKANNTPQASPSPYKTICPLCILPSSRFSPSPLSHRHPILTVTPFHRLSLVFQPSLNSHPHKRPRNVPSRDPDARLLLDGPIIQGVNEASMSRHSVPSICTESSARGAI